MKTSLFNRSLWLLACVLALSGCASSKIASLQGASGAVHPIKALAMAPAGGVLADAVAVELSNRGYNVVDSATVTSMMVRQNINELEIAQPVGLAKLRAQGIDALLSVRAAGGYDMQPQSASARVVSTDTGKVIAGITWQNGWGGMAGSMADRTMRKGLSDAAMEIVNALSRNLRPQ